MFLRTFANLMLLTSLLFSSCDRTANDQSQTLAPGGTLTKIRKDGVVHVGYIIYPPTVDRDPTTGQLTGHFIDTVEEIAKYLGVKVEYHEATWGTFIGGLQSAQFDLSIAATYRTIPRALAVAFTRPLMYLGNSAIVRKGDNRFKGLEDFDKKL